MEFAVPLFDAIAEYGELETEINDAVRRVLVSGQFVGGDEIAEFEIEFAKFLGDSRRVAGVNSGTDALILSLKALGIGSEHEVIVPANTFTATVMAVEAVGAVPILADVDQDLYVLTAEQVRPLVTKNTACIIAVHLYGHPCPMPELCELAAENGVKIIEDAAQAHGAEVRERAAGTFGHAAAFSFYPSKNLGAYGDAGAIAADEQLISRVKMLRNLGRDSRGNHMIPALNSRLDALQAAVLREKLGHLTDWVKRRRQLAAQYDEALVNVGVQIPTTADWARHAFHLYVVRVPTRDRVYEALRSRGIEAGLHYPVPIHKQPAHDGLVHVRTSLATSERLALEVLSLPLYPQMTDEAQEKVIDTLISSL